MAHKKLPIIIKPMITSECWTYYKMAIIQTIPNYEIWLANRFQIYTNEYNDSNFGENGKIYPLSYFSDILEIHDEKILTIPSNKIIEFIVNKIDQGTYLVIDTNLCKLHNIPNSPLKFHETLVYGYDTEKEELLVTLLINHTFHEVNITFQAFQDSYSDILNYYLRNKDRIFTRRKYYHGVTSLKPKLKYTNDNACYDFINKLHSELSGIFYTEQISTSALNSNQIYTYHTGLSCILLLSNNMHDIIDQPDDIKLKKYRSSCLKICENHHLILHSLNWYINTFVKNVEEFKLLIDEYEHCCSSLFNCVLLFYKYECSPNKNTLITIEHALSEVYHALKQLLTQIIPLATQIYTNYLNHRE